MKLGDINLADSIIDLEYKVMVLESILALMLSKNKTLITEAEIEPIRQWAVNSLKQKYPTMGVHRKP